MQHDPREPLIAARYRLGDVLGRGSNAVVFRATDLASGREVAVKRLRHELAPVEEWRARMRREGRAIATLRHPSVVRVSELGEDDEGAPYLVMELLDGETLAARLARTGACGEREAVRIALALLDALVAVHAHGLVHRDLKPSNVLLVRGESGEERATLLDFGLACRRDGSMRVTREGARMGTPLYMSPEQARGASVDERADLWGVGVLLYEMTTGRAPFLASHPLQVLTAVIASDPARPSTRVPSIDPRLEAIIVRALAKQPAQRFASAFEMATALRALGEG